MLQINGSIINLISRTSVNLLKTGGTLLLANLANQALKEAGNETVKALTKDVKSVRREYNEGRLA